jgi:hypothetical protein
MRSLVGVSQMNKSHDESGDIESVPLGTEAPMDIQLTDETVQDTEVSISKRPCAHQRLIDDVRSSSGKPTGKVRCLECGMIFDDPHRGLH